WSSQPSAAFVQSVASSVVGVRREPVPPRDIRRFETPDLDGLWFRELVRRDRVEEMGAFLAPRVQELLARIRTRVPLGPNGAVVDWTRWLADGPAFETWTRFLSAHGDALGELAGIFSERRLWDRLWALGGRNWDVTPLVAILPEPSRVAWFRHWQTPSP